MIWILVIWLWLWLWLFKQITVLINEVGYNHSYLKYFFKKKEKKRKVNFIVVTSYWQYKALNFTFKSLFLTFYWFNETKLSLFTSQRGQNEKKRIINHAQWHSIFYLVFGFWFWAYLTALLLERDLVVERRGMRWR